jgi:LysM repeat protein
VYKPLEITLQVRDAANRGIRGSENAVPSIMNVPRSASGVDDDDRISPVYLAAIGLVVLLVAIVAVAATTLTGTPAATRSEQARAAKLRKLPVYWKVHTGDTYERIARRTGLTVDELETFNRYVDPSTIRPGQRLKLRLHVPKPKPKPPGPRFHTVRTGESFGSIAAKTGHSILRLQRLNRKLKATALQPGARVRLRD